MKIVVIGGTGLIGKKVVTNLRQHSHEVVAASPSSGVNAVTGEGLAQALAGAQVVVDVAHPLGRTTQSWRSSRHQVATSSPRKLRPASTIMRRCRSSAPTACSRVVTSGPRWPRKN
jgi:putative NADH-flavin reductase